MNNLYPQQFNYASPPGYLPFGTHLSWCKKQAFNAEYLSTPRGAYSDEIYLGVLGGHQSELILRDRAPALYLTEEMVAVSLGMEDVPLEADVPFVLESMHLMLPANAFPTEIRGHYITSVGIRVVDSSTLSNSAKDAGPISFRVFARSTEEGPDGHSAMYVSDMATKKIEDGSGYVRQGEYLCANREVDDVSMNLCRLAANVVMSLAYSPSLRQTDRKVENYGKGFGSPTKSGKNLLPITWLGKNENFDSTADAVIEARELSGVKRKSPQMHWRRGHFRKTKNKDGVSKTVFVKPTLICAVEDEVA